MSIDIPTITFDLVDCMSPVTEAVLGVLLAALAVELVLHGLVAGESAAETLGGWKVWLLANNATVMFVLLLVLGAKLVGNGLGGLIG